MLIFWDYTVMIYFVDRKVKLQIKQSAKKYTLQSLQKKIGFIENVKIDIKFVSFLWNTFPINVKSWPVFFLHSNFLANFGFWGLIFPYIFRKKRCKGAEKSYESIPFIELETGIFIQKWKMAAIESWIQKTAFWFQNFKLYISKTNALYLKILLPLYQSC